jgi:hypothetical protein
MKRSLLLLLLVLGVLAAACTTESELPIDDPGNGDAPVSQGACLEGEPDCEDTGVVNDLPEEPLGAGGGAAGTCLEGTGDCNDTPGTPLEPLPTQDENADGPGETDSATGFVVGNGLTVTEALSGDAEGTLAVGGFIVANESGTFLCEALAESFPPQCGGESIAVEGLAIDEYPVEEEGAVRWTNNAVVLFGEVVDGVLVIDDMVNG